MPTDTALLEYIKAENAKTKAWVAEDPDNRCAGTWTEDLEHWHSYEIFTPDEMIHYEAVNLVFEMTREVYGYKPNYGELKKMTIEELDAETKRLGAVEPDTFFG